MGDRWRAGTDSGAVTCLRPVSSTGNDEVGEDGGGAGAMQTNPMVAKNDRLSIYTSMLVDRVLITPSKSFENDFVAIQRTNGEGKWITG